jgi:hypothetical protein
MKPQPEPAPMPAPSGLDERELAKRLARFRPRPTPFRFDPLLEASRNGLSIYPAPKSTEDNIMGII